MSRIVLPLDYRVVARLFLKSGLGYDPYNYGYDPSDKISRLKEEEELHTTQERARWIRISGSVWDMARGKVLEILAGLVEFCPAPSMPFTHR
jgi:hypothetical protein